MISPAAHAGASEASQPCCTSKTTPSNLTALEVEFWRLWKAWDTCSPSAQQRHANTVDGIMKAVQQEPTRTPDDAAIKMRLALARARWTPACFGDDPAERPEKVAAEILDQVATYLESLGRGA